MGLCSVPIQNLSRVMTTMGVTKSTVLCGKTMHQSPKQGRLFFFLASQGGGGGGGGLTLIKNVF